MKNKSGRFKSFSGLVLLSLLCSLPLWACAPEASEPCEDSSAWQCLMRECLDYPEPQAAPKGAEWMIPPDEREPIYQETDRWNYSPFLHCLILEPHCCLESDFACPMTVHRPDGSFYEVTEKCPSLAGPYEGDRGESFPPSLR